MKIKKTDNLRFKLTESACFYSPTTAVLRLRMLWTLICKRTYHGFLTTKLVEL